LWNSWIFYPAAGIFFILIRVPIFLYTDAAFYHEEYARGQIAHDVLQHGFSHGNFLFADDYALGSFFSGVWILPFFGIFGHTLLALKVSALVFSTVALILWILLLTRTCGVDAGRLVGIILIFSPPILQRYQLINMGFHTEAFLFMPLSFLPAVYILNQRLSSVRIFLIGVLLGLFVSYCLTNVLAVTLSVGGLLIHFIHKRCLTGCASLLTGGVLGFFPWMWLKFTHFQGGNVLTILNTGDISTPTILHSLYQLIFIYFPQSVIAFNAKSQYETTLLILVIHGFMYLVACFSWKDGFLPKCLLMYPLIFVISYLIINPVLSVPESYTLNEKRFIIPLIYAFLGIYALALDQVRRRFYSGRKILIILIAISSSVLALNLWMNIFTNYPVYRTAYGQEPGYVPVYRNLSLMVRYHEDEPDITSSKRLLAFRSVLEDLDIDSTINAQAFHGFGMYCGMRLTSLNQPPAFLTLRHFVAGFDKNERDLFFRGLACGCFNRILKNEGDLRALFRVLNAEDWRSFNVGLINACFRFREPAMLWRVLRQISEIHHVPLRLPAVETETIVRDSMERISVLGYWCMLAPGAMRGYVQHFEADPVSLKLLGWWLALEVAPDKEWLMLKLGSDYQNCIQYIEEGMEGFRDGIPFTTFLSAQPLEPYSKVGDSTQEGIHFPYQRMWSKYKPIWPVGPVHKSGLCDCASIVRRGLD